MNVKKLAFALAAGCGLATSAMAQHTPPPFSFTNLADTWQSQDLNGASIPTGTYTTYAVNVQWSVAAGAPFSAEARAGLFKVDRATFVTPPPDPADVYWTSGAPTGGAPNTQPTTLSWSGTLTQSYTGGQPIFFHGRNDSLGDTANWTNITLTLGGFVGPPGPATNIDCASATLVGALPWISPAVTIDSVANAAPSGVTISCQSNARRAVWYRFVPTSDGQHIIDTCAGATPQGSVSNTVLALYTSDTGDCTGTLTEVACNDDGCGTRSTITADLVAGTTYFIVLARVGSEDPLPPGDNVQQLRVRFVPPGPQPAPNDLCDGAVEIPATALANDGDTWLSQGYETVGSTEAGDPTPTCASSWRRGIWFRYTPTANQTLRVSTCAGDTPDTNRSDTVLAVFTSSTGTCTGTFTQVACNDDAGPSCTGLRASLDFAAVADTTYFILVYSWGTGAPILTPPETMQIRVSRAVFVPPPTPAPNDLCSGAIVVPAAQLVQAGNSWLSEAYNNIGSTSTGDPVPPCQTTASRGIWFKYTPTSNVRTRVSTCAGDAPGVTRSDTVLSVYTSSNGACDGTFTNIACNDDGGPACTGLRASLEFNAAAGTTYFILVYSYGTSAPITSPPETLQIYVATMAVLQPPPGNDTCTGAENISAAANSAIGGGNPYVHTQTGIGNALPDSGTDPLVPCSTSARYSVWYLFTPAQTGFYTLSTCTADAPGNNLAATAFAVYAGPNCPSSGSEAIGCLANTGCGTGAQAKGTLLLNAGTTYRVVIARTGTTALGVGENTLSFALLFTPVPPAPANDTCAGATDISAAANPVIAGDGIYSSTPAGFLGAGNAGDPAASCATAGTFYSVFYTYTPTLSGVYSFSTAAANAPSHNASGTVLALYTGSCAGLSQVACANAGTGTAASMTVTLDAGTTYTLMVARNTAGIIGDTYQFSVRRFNVPAGAFPESEPNDTKFAANEFTFASCSNTITGTTTGASTTTPGDASADNFLITLPTNPGIVRWVVSVDSATPGHVLTVRGLTQTAGVPNPGTDSVINTSSATTGNTVRFYTHGTVAPRVYLRITGTTATTAPYVIRFTCTPVTTIDVPGTFAPGSITINSAGQGHTTDTDMWVYDAQLNAIPDYGNDDPGAVGPARLTRTFNDGTYYIAIAPYNLANNLGSPPDDSFRTGAVMDFPGVTANSSITLNANCTLAITDSGGTPVQVPNTRAVPHEINWIRFVVGTPVTQCNPADIAQTDGSAGPDNCVNNGDFQLFIGSFFSANCPGCGQPASVPCNPADIGQTDGSPGFDGCVDNGDFQLFIGSFFSANCPNCGN
jgi:hypothetical protein